jgi:hypothetical protein
MVAPSVSLGLIHEQHERHCHSYTNPIHAANKVLSTLTMQYLGLVGTIVLTKVSLKEPLRILETTCSLKWYARQMVRVLVPPTGDCPM